MLTKIRRLLGIVLLLLCLQRLSALLRLIPGLNVRFAENHKHCIAQEVHASCDEEHNPPLAHIALKKVKEPLWYYSVPCHLLSLPTHRLVDDVSYGQGSNYRHNVRRTVCDTHQDARVIRRQVDVVDLEAEVGGRIDAHSQCQQRDSHHRLLFGDKGKSHQGQHRHIQSDTVKHFPRDAQPHHVLLLQCM